MTTESVDPRSAGLDLKSDAEVLACLLDGHRRALMTVDAALDDIARGAALMARAIRAGGRLIYAGAGSSALMGTADGLELAGTFGIDPAQVRLCMAGGLPQDAAMPGETEDDLAQAARDAEGTGPDDVVIAVTASGRTPYAVDLARRGRAAGAAVIGIANVEGAEIFRHATVAICLPTPPELVAGSTRLGAGTAQKVALNMMSTLMGMRLGHVHDGMMVNLRADNAKLRDRAIRTVARIAGVGRDAAAAALARGNGAVKPAILLAIAPMSHDDALARLRRADGSLRAALDELDDPETIGAPRGTNRE